MKLPSSLKMYDLLGDGVFLDDVLPLANKVKSLTSDITLPTT